MLILVDTNVVLRIVDRSHTQHFDAVEAIDTIETKGHELCIVPQVVYEFWVVATRPVDANGLGMNPRDAELQIQRFLPTFRLLRDERAIFEVWQQLVADRNVKGKLAHDVRLVAAAIRHGISHVVTFNSADFSRYPEVQIIQPHLAAEFPLAN